MICVLERILKMNAEIGFYFCILKTCSLQPFSLNEDRDSAYRLSVIRVITTTVKYNKLLLRTNICISVDHKIILWCFGQSYAFKNTHFKNCANLCIIVNSWITESFLIWKETIITVNINIILKTHPTLHYRTACRRNGRFPHLKITWADMIYRHWLKWVRTMKDHGSPWGPGPGCFREAHINLEPWLLRYFSCSQGPAYSEKPH